MEHRVNLLISSSLSVGASVVLACAPEHAQTYIGILVCYCIVDVFVYLVWPERAPGCTRFATILVHHLAIAYGGYHTRAHENLLFLVRTALVEYSSAALNLHRIVQTDASRYVFLGTWVATRVGYLTWLTYCLWAHVDAPIDMKLAWMCIPLLSYYWTMESTRSLPRWARGTKWTTKSPAVAQMLRFDRSREHVLMLIGVVCAFGQLSRTSYIAACVVMNGTIYHLTELLRTRSRRLWKRIDVCCNVLLSVHTYAHTGSIEMTGIVLCALISWHLNNRVLGQHWLVHTIGVQYATSRGLRILCERHAVC